MLYSFRLEHVCQRRWDIFHMYDRQMLKLLNGFSACLGNQPALELKLYSYVSKGQSPNLKKTSEEQTIVNGT